MPAFKVTLTQILKGQMIQNVIHLKPHSGDYTPAQVAAKIEGLWIPALKPLQAIPLVYTQIVVQNVSVPDLATHVVNISTPGTLGGFDPVMPFLSVVMQKRTNHHGPRGRGRYYIAGFNHTSFDSNGQWAAGHFLPGDKFTTAMFLITRDFVQEEPASDLELCVAPHDAIAPDELKRVTNVQIRPLPGLQRRRCIGVGV